MKTKAPVKQPSRRGWKPAHMGQVAYAPRLRVDTEKITKSFDDVLLCVGPVVTGAAPPVIANLLMKNSKPEFALLVGSALSAAAWILTGRVAVGVSGLLASATAYAIRAI
jgi:hypothetical protein